MRKGIALFLVIVMIALLIPTPAYGAATIPETIQQQIKTTYRKAFQLNNYKSFNGWCATLVNWQTYLLGIDTVKYGCDGKDEFDLYSRMERTTGGYRVRSYPASRYTLRQAFDAITNNGTVDVYNILVGFQKTNTTAGKIYGHACFVHAIIDNKVYFVECFDSGIDGRYWAEGTPIVCSVEEFCRYYNTWTVFDGVIYFGLKNYADKCQLFSADMEAMTAEQTSVMYEPIDEGVNDEDPTTTAEIGRGEIIRVKELLKTPGGNYWYAVEGDGFRGYVPAYTLIPMGNGTSDVMSENMNVPTALHTGHGFIISGVVSTTNSTLKEVIVDVYAENGQEKNILFTARVRIGGRRFSLNTPEIDNQLPFRTLQEGNYRLSVRAVTTDYVYMNGEVIADEKTKEVWNSEFWVTSNWNKHYAVTFDPAGGTCGTDKMAIPAGGTIGSLPVPQRDGYSFTGWYTSTGDLLTEGASIHGDMTLTARWTADGAAYTGWLQTDSGWSYLQDGVPLTGWFTVDGITFYRYGDGSTPIGWREIDGKRYYFGSLGAAQIGWLTVDDNRYYLLPSGEAASGWTQIEGVKYWFSMDGSVYNGWIRDDGKAYYLDEDSACLIGEHVIDGNLYTFQTDGSLLTGWAQRDGKTVYLDGEGNLVTGWQNIDGIACYFGSDGGLYITANDSCSYGCLLNTTFGK